MQFIYISKLPLTDGYGGNTSEHSARLVLPQMHAGGITVDGERRLVSTLKYTLIPCDVSVCIISNLYLRTYVMYHL